MTTVRHLAPSAVAVNAASSRARVRGLSPLPAARDDADHADRDSSEKTVNTAMEFRRSVVVKIHPYLELSHFPPKS
jgi:hypothetical protein